MSCEEKIIQTIDEYAQEQIGFLQQIESRCTR
jgi:hypothetical protein